MQTLKQIVSSMWVKKWLTRSPKTKILYWDCLEHTKRGPCRKQGVTYLSHGQLILISHLVHLIKLLECKILYRWSQATHARKLVISRYFEYYVCSICFSICCSICPWHSFIHNSQENWCFLGSFHVMFIHSLIHLFTQHLLFPLYQKSL